MIQPRLLTKSQAATYCGLSTPTFDVVCPVRPIALGEGVRMRRYDVRKLDEWIDGLQGRLAVKSILDELLDRPDSPATLDDRHVKVLRYMRDHPECETASDIRGAGEHTLNFLKDKGMTEVVGADSKGRSRFKLTRQGKEELAGIDRWEAQYR